MKFKLLEVSRAIAAILVVLHHATLDAPFFYNAEPINNFFYFGMAGVDYFFVLSGFIIYYIHSNDKATISNIKKYLLKRLIRIYPIFLFISSFLLLMYLSIPSLSIRGNLSNFDFIIKSLLLLPQSNPPILTVSWTLVHEIFFYFTFIIIILNKKIGVSLYILWASIITVLQFTITKEMTFPYSFYFNSHNIEFVLGVLLGVIFKDSNFINTIKNYKLLIFGGIILFILNGINQNSNFIQINSFIILLIYGLSSFFIIMGLILLEKESPELKVPKLLILLGSASYSIYLIHLPILSVMHRIVQKLEFKDFLHSDLIFIIVCIIAIISGVVLHLLIEKPLTSFLSNKFIKRVN